MEPTLLQAEQLQLSQTVFIGEVLQPLTTFVASSGLISSDGTTEHSTAGGVAGEQSRGRESPPHPGSGAAQDTIGFPGCEGTLLGHVELLTNQHPKSLGLVSVLQQPAFVLGIAPADMWEI